jgi:hypothetical protein
MVTCIDQGLVIFRIIDARFFNSNIKYILCWASERQLQFHLLDEVRSQVEWRGELNRHREIELRHNDTRYLASRVLLLILDAVEGDYGFLGPIGIVIRNLDLQIGIKQHADLLKHLTMLVLVAGADGGFQQQAVRNRATLVNNY